MKTCFNCEFLEYEYPDYYSNDGGYYCNGREYKTPSDELNHLEKLNSDTNYLDKYKRCHKPIIKVETK